MSLRSAALRIASDLPVGDPTRRKLLAALKRSARRPETAAQKAVWAAWDALDGVDKVGEYNSFTGAVGYLALNVEVDAEYGSAAGKVADQIQKKLKSLDRQTRSWRSAYNMWVEGRTINIPRLLGDVGKTQKAIAAIWKMAAGLKDVADTNEFITASRAADKVVDAFDGAVSVLKAGNY